MRLTSLRICQPPGAVRAMTPLEPRGSTVFALDDETAGCGAALSLPHGRSFLPNRRVSAISERRNRTSPPIR